MFQGGAAAAAAVQVLQSRCNVGAAELAAQIVFQERLVHLTVSAPKFWVYCHSSYSLSCSAGAALFLPLRVSRRLYVSMIRPRARNSRTFTVLTLRLRISASSCTE